MKIFNGQIVQFEESGGRRFRRSYLLTDIRSITWDPTDNTVRLKVGDETTDWLPMSEEEHTQLNEAWAKLFCGNQKASGVKSI